MSGAHWVMAEDGSWINLDACSRIEPLMIGGPRNPRFPCRVTMPDGSTAMVGEQNLHPFALGRSVVPAAAGALAISIIDVSATKGERPTLEDMAVEQHAVIAWHVQVMDRTPVAAPILAAELGSNEYLFLPQPDGGLVSTAFDEAFADVDSAKARVLAEAIEEFDWERQA